MEATLLGSKQLDELFDRLKHSQKRSIVISAYTKSSKPMLQTIKANLIARTLAKSSGNLAKSLGVKGVTGKSILHLGTRRFGIWKGHHSHLIEAGTGERYYTTQSGAIQVTGRVRGKFWFKSGVESKSKETAEGFIDAAVVSFHALIKRANAKRKT